MPDSAEIAKNTAKTLIEGVKPPPKGKAEVAAVVQAAQKVAASLAKKGSTSEEKED